MDVMICQAFDWFDTSGDGAVDKDEFRQAMLHSLKGGAYKELVMTSTKLQGSISYALLVKSGFQTLQQESPMFKEAGLIELPDLDSAVCIIQELLEAANKVSLEEHRAKLLARINSLESKFQETEASIGQPMDDQDLIAADSRLQRQIDHGNASIAKQSEMLEQQLQRLIAQCGSEQDVITQEQHLKAQLKQAQEQA